MKRSYSLLFALAALAVTGLYGTAHAGMTVTLDPGSPTGAGPYDYTYNLQITTTDTVVSGNFFRIYDFLSYDGVHTDPAGWTLTTALSNAVPPPNVILTYGDDPTVTNLTWTYARATIDGASTASVDGFFAESTDALLGANKDYVGRDTQATGPTAGINVDSVGAVKVP